jgi:hypothetical protein
MLEGLALITAVLVIALLLALAVTDAARFDAGVVSAARTALYVILAGAAVLFLGAPLAARMGDRELSRYLEARDPQLDALLLTAVDARSGATGGDTSASLADAVVRRASRSLADSPAASVEQPRARRALLAVVVVLVLAVVVLHRGPATWRHGLALMFAPHSQAAAENPYSIHVQPGDALRLAGDDLRISAEVRGFTPERLTLMRQDGGSHRWQPVSLQQGEGERRFELMLFDLQETLRYQVRDGDLASPVYEVQVLPRPLVERIDLVYHHPDRSGRPPTEVTDGGDIDAVRGTRVALRIVASGLADDAGHGPGGVGRLLLDGEQAIPLRPEGDLLVAEIPVRRDGHYRVELAAPGHGMVPASPEHAIIAREDALPRLALLSPGGDVKVTSIEEVMIAARAEDDLAVRNLDLVISVNGGEEKVMPLDAGALARGSALTPSPSVEGELELFLEERELAPGDMLAYYLRAGDDPEDPARQVKSDIYFMDVRPFDRAFRRARGGGGGGGGGGGQGQGGDQNLSAQQRSLVVALFKLDRDGTELEPEVMNERVGLLEDAQGRIRTRTEAISRRIGARSIMDLNPGYRRMAEELPRAAKAMQEVEALLGREDVEAALPVARTALLHLQRADAALREVRVAESRQRGGGGEASNDLSNLFRLEMDRFRNQYEDISRGNWNPQRQRELDDTLRKLRELAERQQRELDRARGADAGGSEAQRQLAEDVDRLLRELERLTRKREQASEELRQSMQDLQQAAKAMRDAAGQGNARAGEQALDRLRAAQERLDRAGAGRLGRQLDDARAQADAMKRAQEQIARALRGGDAPRRDGESGARGEQAGTPPGAAGQRGDADARGGQPGSSSGEQGQGQGSGGSGSGRAGTTDEAQSNPARAGTADPEDIAARKRALGDDVQRMQAMLDRLALEARQERRAEAAGELRESARGLREALVEQRLRESAARLARDPGGVDAAEEQAIDEALTALQQRLARAARQLGEDPAQAARRTLRRLQDALRGVDRDARRLADAAGRQALRRGSPGSAGRQQGTPGSRGSSAGGERRGGSLGGGGGDGFGDTVPWTLESIRAASAARNAELTTLLEPLRAQQDLRGELDALLVAMEAVGTGAGTDAETLARRHAELRAALQALELALRGERSAEAGSIDTAPRGEALPWRRRQADD